MGCKLIIVSFFLSSFAAWTVTMMLIIRHGEKTGMNEFIKTWVHRVKKCKKKITKTALDFHFQQKLSRKRVNENFNLVSR